MRAPWSRTIRPALAVALFCAALLAACTSAQTSVTAPTADKCAVTASSSPSAFTATGGSGALTISTARDCTWAVSTSTTWVSLSGTEGQGEASLPYSVAPNPAPAARTGAIVVGSQSIQLSQAAAPCRFSLSRTDASIAFGGGRLSFDITTLTGCSWSASSDASWIAVSSGQSGNANGTVTLDVAANSGADRVGHINVAGQIYTVSQGAVPPPP